MSFPDYSSKPKRSDPLYAWPNYSILGICLKGVLRLVSEIAKTLRLVSTTDRGVLRLTSEINKGGLKLTSKITVNC